MTEQTWAQERGSAAELYDRTFVPAIAVPASTLLIALCQLQRGERVLDLACGTGAIARPAAELVGAGGSVVAVDVSPDMIEVARSKPAPTGAEIDWREADAAALPLPDDSVDVAICQMGLMFFKDKAQALGEMRRVVRSGGRVGVSTPGPMQPIFEVLGRGLADHISPEAGGFIRAVFSLPDPDIVAGLLADAGFDDVQATSSAIALDLGPPGEFLWNYIGSTPLGAAVNAAPSDAKTALEADVVGRWQSFVDVSGHITAEQPMVHARGTAP